MIVNRPITRTKMKSSKKYKYFINKAVIIVYGHSPCHLNVTGLKSKMSVNETKNQIEIMFNVKCVKIKLDNIFYSHKEKDRKVISLLHLFYFLRGFCNDDCIVDYTIESFPAMFIKSKSKLFPTLIIFSNGSYSIIGGKSFESVRNAKMFAKKLFLLKYVTLI